MAVRERIDAILTDDRLDDETPGPGKTETIEVLIDEFGWPAVRDHLIAVLGDDHRPGHWRTATHVFWGAVLAKRELPADELIALLYHRFDPTGEAEDNEVWSITCNLRGVYYLSDYNPLEDPAVVKHLRAIRSLAEPGTASDSSRR